MPFFKFSKLIFVLLAISLSVFLPAKVLAADLDISSPYNVIDNDAVDGDILTSTEEGLKRSALPYDPRLFGVLQSGSLVVLKTVDQLGKPVARFGTTSVNVTTVNGEIKAGDYITTSDIPGKGQKATINGYVLGVAQSAFKENDGAKIDYKAAQTSPVKQVASGKINVALKIEFAEINKSRNAASLFDSFNIALFNNIKDPSKFAEVFRYLAAGLVVLSSFIFGFLTFSRSVPKSIEAIGRNPLAEKAIIFSVILNIAFTVITAAIGIVAALFVLRL